jgi:putative hydrolase of the HAD superfamily
MARGLNSLEDHLRQAAPDRICVVFDGDDTLWITEPLYDEARSIARSLVEADGLDGSRWEILERRIDIENVEILGYSPLRFPRSCRQAYEVYQSANGGAVDQDLAKRIEGAASAVFERSAQLMPGANETLRALKRSGARLGLLTKGDPAVQRKRIAESRLAPLFDAISIVPRKSTYGTIRFYRLSDLGCWQQSEVRHNPSTRRWRECDLDRRTCLGA